MRQNLLLLQDVIDLGKCGEIVSVKSGYARNYLIPKKKAVIVKEHTLRMQKPLKEERAKLAVTDKKESEALANVLEIITLEIHVKVDPEGKMYGSVSQQEIVSLIEKHDIKLEKKDVILKHAIKDTGTHTISLKLKEGVIGTCKLDIIPEGGKKPVEVKKEEEEALKEEDKVEEVIEEEVVVEEKTSEE